MYHFSTTHKVLAVICIICLTTFSIFAQSVMEQRITDSIQPIRMAVMQGPSGFSSIALAQNEGRLSDTVRVDLQVFPSPNEVIARLANGELDVAALPTNVAANLYNKGVKIRLAAVVGEGNLMLVSTDQTITEFEHLAGRNIAIPGAGSTPDQITRIITATLGYDPDNDVVFDYSIAAPAQLAQMLIADKVDIAVLPEPFVTLVFNGNPKMRALLNLQEVWNIFTGSGNYPMTVIVVSDSFYANNPQAFDVLMVALKDSVDWVNANPEEAGVLIEEASIMKAAIAAPAIPRSNLVFRTAEEAMDSLSDYFKMLYGYDYLSIGGALPDASFYLDY
jgi:NitT/TauT family transport system substrate-binding protein